MQKQITVQLPWIECPTCGTNIGDIDTREQYNQLIDEGVEPDEAFEQLGINNTCCRSKFWIVPVIPTCRGRELNYEAFRKNSTTSLPGGLFSINSQFSSSAGKPIINKQLPSKELIKIFKIGKH
jgi:DNA-directed RNA polymerase subunit N (RpoN/RPB10)